MTISGITILGNNQVSSLVEKSPAFISEVIHLPKSSNSRDALRVLGRGHGGEGVCAKGINDPFKIYI